MPTEQFLLTADLTFQEAFQVMEAQNLTEVQVNTLLYGLLAETIGETKRVFKYGSEFEDAKPLCKANFSRSFQHIDWIDGESVVQAEENTIEEGFNSRFHKIEDDLDSLANDIRTSFGCIGDLRAELAARLSEIRTAINAINTDIFEKHKDDNDNGGMWAGPFYPPTWGGGYVLENPYPGGLPGGVRPGLDPGRPYPGYPTDLVNPRPWEEQYRPIEGIIADTFKGPMFDGAAVTRMSNDPTRATVAGMPARRLDVQTFNGKAHEVWSTSMGLVLTPAAEGVAIGMQEDRSWTNQRTEVVVKASRWVAENGADLAAIIGRNGTTVKALSDKFGDTRLDGGLTVKEILSILPSGTKIEKPAQITGLLAERAASAISRDGLVTETLVANVGFQQNDVKTEDLGLENFKAIPLAVRKELISKGFTTVGKFQSSSPNEISELLARTNSPASTGEVASWIGEALVVGQLGQVKAGR